MLIFFIDLNAQEESCFKGVNKKLDEWAEKDFESPAQARRAKMRIVEDLVGCDMPEFEVMTLDSIKIRSEELIGKVTVVNFWFIGCPPCEVELPGLNKLVDEFKDEEVVFLAFGRDDEEEVVEHLKSYPFNYQQVPQTNAPGVFLAFEVRFGYPYHLVFNTEGKLVYTKVGGNLDDEDIMYKNLKPVLKELISLK